MAKHTYRWFGALLLPLCFGVSAHATPAQSLDSVRSDIGRGNLDTALKDATENTKANSSDAVGQQVRGILAMASGNPSEAEAAFTQAIRLSGELETTETGLEKLDGRGTPLHESLNRQKVTLSLSAGGAEAFNNRGAARIVLGKIEDGLSDLDEAMRLRQNWGVPSANAAVGWLENNSPRQARKFANQALGYNEATAKVYASLAESQMRIGRWKDADASLKRFEDKDADYPYGLYLRSQWYHEEQRPRDEQRALFQALALDPQVSSEDRQPLKNSIRLGAGNQSSDHQRAFDRGYLSSLGFQTLLQRDRGEVENVDNSYQSRDIAQTSFGRSKFNFGAGMFASTLDEHGDHPGDPNQIITPDATYEFRRTNLALFQRVDPTKKSRLLFTEIYRKNDVRQQSSAATASYVPLKDDQFGIEGRFDTALHGTNRRLYLGYAWMQTKRDLGAPTAGDPLYRPSAASSDPQTASAASFNSFVEPNEQLLPNGTSVLKTAYAITKSDLAPTVTGAVGPIMGQRGGGTAFFLPYLDVHWNKSAKSAYRVSALPRTMNANSDLFPVWALPNPAQINPDSSIGNQTHDFNQESMLEGPDGREMSYEISSSTLMSSGSWLTITGFHREFRDMYTLSQDPRLSQVLLLASLPKGSSTGVEMTYVHPIGGRFSIDLGLTVQKSHASYNSQNVSSGGDGDIGYLPKTKGTFNINYTGGDDWTVSVKTIQTGTRTAVEEFPLPNVSNIYCAPGQVQTAKVSPSTAVHIEIGHRLKNGQNVFLQLSPINRGGFFYNYPGSPFVLGGYEFGF